MEPAKINSNEQNPHSLLVIDDNKDITDIVAKVGKELDFAVTCVNDYDRVARAYAESNPSCIVLDLDLGLDRGMEISERGYDGLAILNLLAERGCKADIVIISGSDKEKREITTQMGRELNLNVRGSMAKPFEVTTLEKVLGKLKQAQAQ